jgi:predicted regulator of Ras-like GTPase activity (Roadblock/LC7/MglB family)
MVTVRVKGAEQAEKEARRVFLAAVKELVARIAAHQGVTASFACHDGLLLEKAGRALDLEAFAAMSQSLINSGIGAASHLSLGHLHQMAIVGHEHKLALFWLGQIAVGIVSPTHVQLREILKA